MGLALCVMYQRSDETWWSRSARSGSGAAEALSADRSIAGFGMWQVPWCGPCETEAQIVNILPPAGSACLHHFGLEPAQPFGYFRPIRGQHHCRSNFEDPPGTIPLSLYSITVLTFFLFLWVDSMLSLIPLFLIWITPVVESALVAVNSGSPSLAFSKEQVLAKCWS